MDEQASERVLRTGALDREPFRLVLDLFTCMTHEGDFHSLAVHPPARDDLGDLHDLVHKAISRTIQQIGNEHSDDVIHSELFGGDVGEGVHDCLSVWVFNSPG